MKRKALRGIVILLIALLICFFFSGTIKTMTTAKVKIAYSDEGLIKEQIPLNAYLVFPETEEIVADYVPDGIAFTITKLNVHRGSFVHTGDILFETEISGIKEMTTAQEKEYADMERELLELKRQYSGILFSNSDQRWIETYDTYLTALLKKHQAEVALEVVARLKHVILSDGRIPENITDETVHEAQNAVDAAATEEETAKKAMDRAFRAGVSDDVYNYTLRTRMCLEKMEQAHVLLVNLLTASESMKTVRAPHAGYIVDINIAAGEQWTGLTAAMTISSENPDCLFRADISDVSRTLSINLKSVIRTFSGAGINSSISAVGYDSLGNPVIDIPVLQEDLKRINTVNRLMRDGTTVEVNYISDTETRLLPSAAIRWGESGAYVYVAEETTDIFGASVYKISKMPITVLDEADGVTALSIDLYIGPVAYMEDRYIAEGMEVMEYD